VHATQMQRQQLPRRFSRKVVLSYVKL